MTPETQSLVYVVIATLVSPLALKVIEFVFSKSSENTRLTHEKLDALGRRVDELRDLNTQQSVQIGVLQSKNDAQANEIRLQANEILALQAQIIERDARILEMEEQINTLKAINEAKSNNPRS